MIDDIIKLAILNTVKEQEKIIREIVEQGYKYLAIYKDIQIKDGVAKCNYKYGGCNSIEEIQILKENGFEIYDLSRVIEYL